VTPATRWRAAAIGRLGAERFDVLVIGGGITGAGIARDAALRGLSVALLEHEDFGAGTSSRSSRLVHGGIRYLEHGHLRLVFESSRERRTLFRIAPHLVRPLAFTWPVYRGARISRRKLYAGLALYDALALFRNVARHQRLSPGEVLEREPSLQSRDLVGGARYFDAATDDARLTLATILAALDAGAVALNHATASALLVEGGRATGAEATDRLTGERLRVPARVVVNATGPWSDEVRRLEAPDTPRSIRGSRGAHVAVPRARIRNQDALTMIHPGDGRILFTLPAGDLTILGTTETPSVATPSEVRADHADVRYLLAAANAYFPDARLAGDDVVAAWAGIRPLAARYVGADAGAASREHAIATGPAGVLHVTGGKLTTYRVMARDVTDAVVERISPGRRLPCRTADVPLPGGDAPLDIVRADVQAVIRDAGMAERLATAYGTGWTAVRSRAGDEPRLMDRLAPDAAYAAAEFVHAARAELACTLGDLLMRRTPLAFETRDHARSLAPSVASLVAPVLGWDPARIRSELDAYEREVARVFAIDNGTEV
jgi:glycerol-3-phosphate dehydrogenase